MKIKLKKYISLPVALRLCIAIIVNDLSVFMLTRFLSLTLPVVLICAFMLTFVLISVAVMFYVLYHRLLERKCKKASVSENTLDDDPFPLSETESCSDGEDESNVVLETIYERLLAYFRSSQPYLDHNLKIDDVARKLYTNRIYLSRAIGKCAHKNYPQFINTYRVQYAVKCFKENPHLRVNQMAYMSGFRSVASFNVSFRAVMSKPPGEWTRDYRNSLVDKAIRR